MINLILDIGNTRTKIAVIQNETRTIINETAIEGVSVDKILSFVDGCVVDCVVVCSVRDVNQEVLAALNRVCNNVLLLTHDTPLPLVNGYATPHTLGFDRMAAAVGAYYLYGNYPMLVVDFGTAITIDLVVDRVFMGGNISPGASLRFKSLHEFTDRLPLCTLDNCVPMMVADNTQSAVESGVSLSIVYEIETYITRFQLKYPNLKIIFTGGDAKYFANKLKSAIFVKYELVILGLNEILNYNNEISKKD